MNVPHAITYQSGTFQELETNPIYMSFHKMVFYLKDAHVKIRCDHAPLHKFMYSVKRNDKVHNWSQEIYAITPYCYVWQC